jgi:predicted ATPase/DNA-binding SARP family transcriptional activator
MPGSTPVPRTAFFGRELELRRIRKHIESRRLVTLTGVGGCGKTRLALSIARKAVPAMVEGVGWVDLTALDDPNLVASAVCSALEVRSGAGNAGQELLRRKLNRHRWLLVLDNCESVLDGCADLLEQLLDGCANLRVLATSRQALGLTEEVLFPVGPLPVPRVRKRTAVSLDSLAETPSVQLLVDRAQALDPDFDLTEDNAAPIISICNRLEGIPLALELAAARLHTLSVKQLDDQLATGIELLEGRGRNQGRHGSLRSVLEWSYEQLDTPERMSFRRLGMFSGSASLESCQTVCSDQALEGADMVRSLSALIEQSLVQANDHGTSKRYRLLEPIRRFALDKLEQTGELESTAKRHADHFKALAGCLAPDLRGPERMQTLELFHVDHENFRRAWDFFASHGNASALSSLGRSLFWFWHFGGYFAEGRMRSEEALALADPASDAQAGLLYTAGALAWMQGDYAAGRRLLEASIETAESEDLPFALRELAGLHIGLGNLEKSAMLYQDSIRLLRDAGATWDLGVALVMLADVTGQLGDPSEALALRQEARTLFSRTGDPWGQSLVHFGLGLDLARAGELTDARIEAGTALALQEKAGDPWNLGQMLTLKGEIEVAMGNPERAAELFSKAVSAFFEVCDRTSLPHVVEQLAEVDYQRGKLNSSIRLLAASRALFEQAEASYPFALSCKPADPPLRERLWQKVDEAIFAEQWAQGSALTPEEVAEAVAVPTAAEEPFESLWDSGSLPDLRVFALGAPRIYSRRRQLQASDFTYALPRQLLFHLLFNAPQTKQQIGVEFWPDASHNQLTGRFRTTLYQLRQALGAREWISYRNGRYEFNRDMDYWLDVEAFETEVARAGAMLKADPTRAGAALQRAIELYRGDFLDSEPEASWVLHRRESLRQSYIRALLDLGEIRASEGALGEAIKLYRQAAIQDDLNEDIHRHLARCLASSGDRTSAVRVLEDYRERLERELAAEPSAALTELQRRLERGETLSY